MNNTTLSQENPHLKNALNFYQEGVIATKPWFQVVAPEFFELFKVFDFKEAFSSIPEPIELLDVGCGTGGFPSLLRTQLPPNMPIIYDTLDPSSYCLSRINKRLQSMYKMRTAINSTIEEAKDTSISPNGYDLIWSIHSLCFVARERLAETILKLNKWVEGKKGVVFIYLYSAESFFEKVDQIYKQQLSDHSQPEFLLIEEICDMVASLGIQHSIKKMTIYHSISSEDQHLLEVYLKQCVLDSTPFSVWQQNEVLHQFLQSYRDDTMYHFPQDVWLLMFSPDALKVKEWRSYLRPRQ